MADGIRLWRAPLSAIAGAAAVVLLLAGCDYTAVVTPLATGADDVRVAVAGPGGLGGATAGVGSIYVTRGPSREVVWVAAIPEDKGPFPALGEIRYGVLPPGFVEKRKPAPLRAGDEIWIEVHGPAIRGEARIVVAPAR